MKRLLAPLSAVAALLFLFGESAIEARGLRRCKAVRCAPCPTMSWNPCWQAGTVGVAQASSATAEVSAAMVSQARSTPKTETKRTSPVEKTGDSTKGRAGESEAAKAPAAVVKVQALLIVDDASKVSGPAAVASAKLLTSSLAHGLGKGVNITTLKSDDLSAGNLVERIRNLSIDPDDAFVVFVIGPGSYDEMAKDFVFDLTGGKIKRSQLKAEALAKKARFTLLFTDPVTYGAAVEPLQAEVVSTEASTLPELMGRYKGIVDVHGCSMGQEAFARGDLGGCFTLSLIRELSRQPRNWTEVVSNTNAGTDQLYKDSRIEVLKSELGAAIKKLYRDQESQNPVVLTPIDQVGLVGNIAPYDAPYFSTSERMPAELIVTAPADATLFIDGQPSTQTGEERTFQTPPLEPGKKYCYELRISQVRGRSEWVATQKARVRAGETVRITFDGANMMAVGGW